MDYEDAKKNKNKDQFGLATLYGFRSFTQFGGGGYTILVAASYADPLLKQLSTRYAKSRAIAVASRFTGWALTARAGLMLTGLGFSIATLAVSAAIWYFSDDELQDWCEESAFGMKPKDKRFTTAKAQMESFDKALLDVL